MIDADIQGIACVGGLVGKNSGGTLTSCGMTGTVSAPGCYVGGLSGWNKNVKIVSSYSMCDVTGTEKAGGLVGNMDGGKVLDCYTTGNVIGDAYIGGLAGISKSVTISDCYTTGSVSGSGPYIGGITGEARSGAISNSGATGMVSGAEEYVGGLAGFCDYSTFSDCYATGAVNGGWYVGGLVGRTGSCTFSECHTTGDVSGNSSFLSYFACVGGLVGRAENNTFSKCYTTGNVSGVGCDVGGLVGWNAPGTITSCYTTGAVCSTKFTAGGLVGTNSGAISNSYSLGSVTAISGVGGLVGQGGGILSNCYAAGAVNGDNHTGGLVGSNSFTTTASFWDIETSGTSVGVGYGSSTGVIGKTTAEMKTLSTFVDAGWDFEETWAMCEGTNTPRLQWQIPAGDWVCPDGVNVEDLEYFAIRWLMADCAAGGNCDGADLDGDGAVDLADWAVFAGQWLAE